MSSSIVTQAKLLLAIDEHRRGNLDLAEKLYREIVSQNPNESDAIHLLGVLAIQAEQFPMAIALIEQAIAMNPKAEYYGNLGVAFEKMDRLEESQRAYEKALEIKPDYVEALLNLGIVLSRRNDFAKAIAIYVTATQLAPYSFEAWHNLGIAYSEADNDQSALSAYEHAVQLNPINSNVFANMGLVFVKQGKLADARIAFEKAVQLDSSHVQANKQLAIIFRSQQQYSEAIRHARQALLSSNDDLECKLLLIGLLQQTHAWDALTGTLNPGVIADQMLEMTTRTSKNSHETSEAFGIHPASQMLPLVSPLSILSLPCEVAPHVNLAFAKRWAASQSLGHRAGRRVPAKANVHRKLRIGYLSADFRAHPVGYCLAELIESHDRDRFEVFAYSNGHDDGSEIRQRLVKAFDQWRELSHLSVQASAEQIRSDEIDILVDLHGYTEGARTPILSLRPAPIQVNYLGFPGTMGANFIDYILVDEYVSPKENRNVFQETPIYLPGCYLPRDGQRSNISRQWNRSEVALPEDAFVFCAFSSPHKMTAEIFDCWLRILSQVPKSVLWLRCSSADADNLLRARARRSELDSNRLIFAPIVSMQEHLGRQRLADLFLDTFPYNQHSTAQDALAMGLPLLTMSGSNFPSRVAGSLLANLDLLDLISTNISDYEKKAVDYALDREYQKRVRERLKVALDHGKLANGKSSAQKIELAFLEMVSRIPAKVTSPSMVERAFQLHAARDYPAAESLYKEMLNGDADNSVILEGFGILLVQTSRLSEGIDFLKRAVAASPKVAQHHYNLAQALKVDHQLDEALHAWRGAVTLDPNCLDAWNELVHVYVKRHQWEDAKMAIESSLRLSPHQTEIRCDLADVYLRLGQPQHGIARYREILKANPHHVRALNNLANVMKMEGCLVESMQLYERAIQNNPDSPLLYYNRANVLCLLDRVDEGRLSYQRAIELDPKYTDAWIGLGVMLQRTQALSQAYSCFERAVELAPQNIMALEKLIATKQMLCQWDKLDALEEKLFQIIESRGLAPFELLPPQFMLGRTKPTSREQQRAISEHNIRYLHLTFGTPEPRFRAGRRKLFDSDDRHRRLKIGYLSSDFRTHPVGMVIAPIIEQHDRQRFEIFSYSYGPDDGSEYRQRIQGGSDHFTDIRSWSVESSVQKIVDDRIDILIDLQGHTGDSRTEILLHRPAHIQALYLGFAGTSGANFVDYLIADDYVVPPSHRQAYSESVIYLPGCFMTNTLPKDHLSFAPSRTSLNFPEDVFIFCAFHGAGKLNAKMIDVWAKLLKQVSHSVLWLQHFPLEAEMNLRRELANRYISDDRLFFAKRVSHPLHVARHKVADLFLDTFPYNAHSTACEVLSMNLPMVTLSGETFASRVAGSVLHTLGLDELIANSHDEYFQLAYGLATQPEQLNRVRETLRNALMTTDLFDPRAFAGKIEAAYITMWNTLMASSSLNERGVQS